MHGGGLRALAIAAVSSEVETQREVAATLCNLSLGEEFKLEIMKSGVISSLITMVTPSAISCPLDPPLPRFYIYLSYEYSGALLSVI